MIKTEETQPSDYFMNTFRVFLHLNGATFDYVTKVLEVLMFSSWVDMTLVSAELLPQMRAALSFFLVNSATSCSLKVAAVKT